jgi:hypothetical protein
MGLPIRTLGPIIKLMWMWAAPLALGATTVTVTVTIVVMGMAQPMVAMFPVLAPVA